MANDRSGNYMAYSITTPAKDNGVVRVTNRKTSDRILIKGMLGPVVDLAFSHSTEEAVIGAVDSHGNLFVYKVTEETSGLSSERLVEVMRSGQEQPCDHRLVWCPYVPDGEVVDRSGERMLILSHGSQAEVWSLDKVVEEHGPGPLTPADVTAGLMIIREIGGNITDAAFSPTGEAVAVAISDGSVKFFQVSLMLGLKLHYFEHSISISLCLLFNDKLQITNLPYHQVYLHDEGAPRCLKTWQPHGDAPLSSLLWLDDHTNPKPDTSFWKFVVTGANYNSELKVWCSSTWTCLQTIKFQRPDEDSRALVMKAVIDPTAQYLILSDINCRLVYVLNLLQTEDKAEVVAISEFASPSPILTLSCLSAGIKTVVQTSEGTEVLSEENKEDGGEESEMTVIALTYITPRSLQKCSIIYEAATSSSSLNVSLAAEPVFPPARMMTATSPQVTPSSPPHLTPAGMSSPRAQLPLPPNMPSSMPGLAEAATKISLLSPEQFQSPPVAPPAVIKPEPVLTFSGNSSPSREVADILEAGHYEDDVDGNENEEEEEDEEEETASFRDIKSTPTPHNTSIKFPTPPVPPVTVPVTTSTLDTEELEKNIEKMIAARLDTMEKKVEMSVRKENQATLERLDSMLVKMTNNMTRVMEQTISSEVQRTLPGLVRKSLQPVEKEMIQKVSGIEQRVAKELSSGGARDTIGRAVAGNVSGVIEASYRQAFASQVTGMERAFSSILKQINDQFMAGTKEYEATLARKLQVENADMKEVMTPVTQSVQHLTNELRQMKGVVDKVRMDQASLGKQIGERQAVTGEEISAIVRREVTEAASPRQADLITPQKTIKTLIQSGQINEAFQAALSCSDLAMVMFTCELVNTTQVFNSATCPLSQSVLLSLIQQLSVDLSDKTQIKHAYLHEALVNLDPDNPMTKMHMKTVLRQLETSLQRYIQDNPNSKMTRNLKILSMAASSHLQSK